ncbi:MAG TPA: tetratricopeptide repeat protein [Pyrinomonadaceae bacterium]|jgi:Flp pilus assembly protein TadD
MRNRTINAFIIALVLTLGVSTLWSAGTTGRDGDDAANVLADGGSEVGTTEDGQSVEAPKKKKKGGGFFGIFKAPIKAVGRLFGAGGDDKKVTRLSEKDVQNFESVAALRVNDSRTPAVAAEAGDGSAREHFERGRDLLDAGQLNEAITELSRAAALDPKMKKAQRLLAIAYERRGLHDSAARAFERALDDAPDDPQTLNDLGWTLYLNGQYRAAVDRLKRAAKLAPADERILNNLALAQCRLGKFNDAFKSFARAGGEFQGRVNTATLAERMGRDPEAIAQYEAARRLQPESAVVLRRLADLYRRTGQPDKAAEAQQALGGAKDENIAARD